MTEPERMRKTIALVEQELSRASEVLENPPWIEQLQLLIKSTMQEKPQIVERIVTVGWLNVYNGIPPDNRYPTSVHLTREEADSVDSSFIRLDCQEITIKKRSQVRTVERCVRLWVDKDRNTAHFFNKENELAAAGKEGSFSWTAELVTEEIIP